MSDAGERLLCRMIPKTTNYGGGFGGRPELTPLDIAAAMAYMKLSDFETRYICAALLQAEDWGPTSPLGYAAWDWAVSKAIRGNWVIPKGKETVRRLSFVALACRIDRRHFTCRSCNGVGTMLDKQLKRLKPCQACEGRRTDADTGVEIGNGLRQRSDRFYGRLLAVDHKTYRATWEPRLKELISDLQAIEGRVVTHIRRVIFEI